MNIFEFIAFVAVIFGIVYGFSNSLDEGAWEAILGALKGAGIAYVWFVVSMMALLTLLSLCLRYRPPYPRCKNGCCRDIDYTFLYLENEPTGHHQWLQESREGKLVRCRCGTIYLDSLRDRRFYEVLDDGTLIPFMRYSPWGRWRPDNDELPGAPMGG